MLETHHMVEHRKNCETALIQGIPSIPGIQDVASISSILYILLKIVEFDWIVKFGQNCEI